MVFGIVSLVVSVILHEVAHGYAAWRMGDPTARWANRLTLNPLAHIDLVGSVILPLILVVTGSPILLGWAKQVPFNPGYFRDPRKGIMVVGAAGPLTNLALALVSGLACRLIYPYVPLVGVLLALFCRTNVALAVFNLIPIPPLDGSRVALGLIPPAWVQPYLHLERYGFVMVFVLLWLGVLDRIIHPLTALFMRLFLGG
jgi:Zn-dependent protease